MFFTLVYIEFFSQDAYLSVMGSARNDSTEKEDDASVFMAVKILEFQEEHKDEPVPNTVYSTYFIDVQLKSLATHPDAFYPELFARLLNIAADKNVCAWIWSGYQELFVELIHKLDSIEAFTDDNMPGFSPYFLKLLARVLHAQVDVRKEGNLFCTSLVCLIRTHIPFSR